jgi:hypothetical protein
MRRARLVLLLLVFGALFVGSACTVRGGVHASYHTPAAVELVEVRPGVWVAVDYHRPLFYSDGYYWMWRDGAWLRSYSYYGGSWVVVHHTYVPYSLRYLDHHPRYYVRYRPAAHRVRYTAPRTRDHRRGAAAPVRVRDHRRGYEPVPSQRGRDAAPRTRDHRPAGQAAPRSRDHRQSGQAAPRTRDHRQPESSPPPRTRDHRDDSRDTRSRDNRSRDSRSRDRDDGPRTRDHRGSSRDSRSAPRSRDRQSAPAQRGRPR